MRQRTTSRRPITIGVSLLTQKHWLKNDKQVDLEAGTQIQIVHGRETAEYLVLKTLLKMDYLSKQVHLA